MSPTKQRQKQAASVPKPRTPQGDKRSVPEKSEAAGERQAQHGGVTLPVVHARVPMPSIGLPAASSVPGRVLWLGGLGALAVFGAVDWPVVVVVAAGTWVAEQRARERLEREEATRAEAG